MEEYIEFKGNMTKDLGLESVIEPISNVGGVMDIEKGFPEGPNRNLKKGIASVRLKGNFDPCRIYSIITNAGYYIIKTETRD